MSCPALCCQVFCSFFFFCFFLLCFILFVSLAEHKFYYDIRLAFDLSLAHCWLYLKNFCLSILSAKQKSWILSFKVSSWIPRYSKHSFKRWQVVFTVSANVISPWTITTCAVLNEQIKVQMGINPYIRQWKQIQKSEYFDHIHQWSSSAEKLKH